MAAAGRMRALLPTILIGLLLEACGSQPRTAGYGEGGHYGAGRPIYKVGAPYRIGGVWYTPAVDYNYDESGVASWYGQQFDRKYTANGEVFDLNELTAAHRTLPMPSIVQVTNLENGRSLEVRVNDRGPFARGRIIDVSRRASQLLGFAGTGTALVRVRIMKEESIRVADLAKRNGGDSRVLVAEAPIPAVASPVIVPEMPPLPEKVKVVPVKSDRRIFIQAGAFSVRGNAERVQSRIAPLGSVKLTTASLEGVEVYRVRLGPVPTVEEADQLLSRVVDSGYPEARIVVD